MMMDADMATLGNAANCEGGSRPAGLTRALTQGKVIEDRRYGIYDWRRYQLVDPTGEPPPIHVGGEQGESQIPISLGF